MLVTTKNLNSLITQKSEGLNCTMAEASTLYYTRIKYLIKSICNVFWTIYTDLAIQGFKETTWHMG